MRKVTRRRWLVGLGAGAATGLAAAAICSDRWDLRTSRVTVPLRGLGGALDGFRIAHLSDLHRGRYGPASFIREAVDRANLARPDLVVLTGDYVTRSARFLKPCAEELARLTAPHGKLAVFGNHEHWTDPDEALRQLTDTAGCQVLRNESVTFLKSGASLCIVGLDDPWTHHEDFDRAFASVPADAPVVVLSHTPDTAPEAARRSVGLVLAGHTHGGQVVLPGIGPPVVWARTGRRFGGGLNYERATAVFTNRGIGVGGIPLRINCPPEVAVITLRAA